MLKPRHLVLALSLLLANPAQAAAQELRLTNLRPSGFVQVEVYADAGSWQRARAPVLSRRLPVSDPSQVLALAGLPPGRYAIRAWQPVPAASQAPMLPVSQAWARRGYSRQPLPRRAPPSFNSAAVEVRSGETVALRMNLSDY